VKTLCLVEDELLVLSEFSGDAEEKIEIKFDLAQLLEFPDKGAFFGEETLAAEENVQQF
jgi:hypothetical protein